MSSKHFNPKFKKQRKLKYLKIELPDFQKSRRDEKLSPDEMRIKMKKDGTFPPRNFEERPINIASTGGIFEEYVPPEGDGKSSLISKDGAKQRFTELEKKGKSFMQLRKIRQFDEDLTTKEFAQTSQDIMIEAHKLLENVIENEDRLHELVTERAHPIMTFGLDRKSFRWNFIESVEPPRVVHVRTTEMLAKDNIYGQITIRMHTKQTLAIYDQFGRLMYGNENIAKNVLEYIVMEKHLANEYGVWRIHDKIVPSWMRARDPLIKTYRQVEFNPIEDTTNNTDEGSDVKKEIAQ